MFVVPVVKMILRIFWNNGEIQLQPTVASLRHSHIPNHLIYVKSIQMNPNGEIAVHFEISNEIERNFTFFKSSKVNALLSISFFHGQHAYGTWKKRILVFSIAENCYSQMNVVQRLCQPFKSHNFRFFLSHKQRFNTSSNTVRVSLLSLRFIFKWSATKLKNFRNKMKNTQQFNLRFFYSRRFY